VVLTDASSFPTAGYATIGTEAIKYTGKSTNTLTGVTRGADSTTAATHADGSPVFHLFVAAHHNALKDEIKAIETSLDLTASRAVVTDSNGRVAVSAVTSTELGRVAGVTSAIQTQIDGKEASITTLSVAKGGTNSGTTLNNNRVMTSQSGAIKEASAITASRALVSDSDGIPTHSAVTSTTLAFLDATSSVQTQIDAKAPTSRTLTAAGLVTGGGTLASDRTFTVTAATQSDQETGTSNTVAVTPGVQKYHPSAAKAWVNFNGTGTPAITVSFNCSSITDNGVGDFSINFTTAFSSADYCGVTCVHSDNTAAMVSYAGDTNPTASAFRMRTLTTAGVAADRIRNYAAFFGDQ
jgi:hypothetical protein